MTQRNIGNWTGCLSIHIHVCAWLRSARHRCDLQPFPLKNEWFQKFFFVLFSSFILHFRIKNLCFTQFTQKIRSLTEQRFVLNFLFSTIDCFFKYAIRSSLQKFWWIFLRLDLKMRTILSILTMYMTSLQWSVNLIQF